MTDLAFRQSNRATIANRINWKNNPSSLKVYMVFQKFVPIVNRILRKVFNASLGKCKLIQVRNLSK